MKSKPKYKVGHLWMAMAIMVSDSTLVRWRHQCRIETSQLIQAHWPTASVPIALCRPLLLAVDGLASYHYKRFRRAFQTEVPRLGHRRDARGNTFLA